jgi:hypothetical protein
MTGGGQNSFSGGPGDLGFVAELLQVRAANDPMFKHSVHITEYIELFVIVFNK